jgi:hypothetical protein
LQLFTNYKNIATIYKLKKTLQLITRNNITTIYKLKEHYNYLQITRTLELFTNYKNITTIYKLQEHYHYLQITRILQLNYLQIPQIIN